MIKKLLPIFWLILILMFIYVPILILVVYSFTDATMVGANVSKFSLHNYVTLMSNQGLRTMIFDTLFLAIGTAIISTVLGTLGAIGSYYSKRVPKMLIDNANQIPVVNADVVTGFSICVLLIVMLGINKDTFIPLIVGHVVLSVPFVYLSVTPKLKQMDNNLYEAALDLGATPTQALFKVVLPQLLPGVISGFMLAVTLSLDDYFITTYTKPSTFNTISTYVVNATKGSQTEIKTALWALTTAIFVLVITVVVISNLISSKKKEEIR